MPGTPCRNCQNRHTLCWDTCEVYQQARDKARQIKILQNDEKHRLMDAEFIAQSAYNTKRRK